MKKLFVIFIIIIALGACNNKKRSEEVANYAYSEEKTELNSELKTKFGDWVKEGAICYGLVVLEDTVKTRQFGKPVRVRVINFQDSGVKVKSLEKINISRIEGCPFMKLERGQTWVEKDGELFKTKEEAIAYLKQNNWIEEEQ